jgi:hypothetical protein
MHTHAAATHFANFMASPSFVSHTSMSSRPLPLSACAGRHQTYAIEHVVESLGAADCCNW